MLSLARGIIKVTNLRVLVNITITIINLIVIVCYIIITELVMRVTSTTVTYLLQVQVRRPCDEADPQHVPWLADDVCVCVCVQLVLGSVIV